MRIRLGLLPS
uniref:Uncharacterized protein n=1 Tax=Anguilla anguilla TaxID=7936 RepID=A0A0E9VPT0_ANGAN